MTSPDTVRSIAGYVFMWLMLAIYTAILLLISLVTLNLLGARAFAALARSWGRISLWGFGIKVVAPSADLLQRQEARVVVFNHQSALDALWIASILPLHALVIVKKELRYVPFLNLALWAAGFIFIDRTNRDKALARLKNAATKIRSKRRSLFIAPEGTRTSDGKMLPFKKGAFRIAAEGGIPIFPIIVTGAFELLPKDKILPRSGIIRLSCLDAVQTSEWKVEELDKRVAGLHDLMNAAYDKQQACWNLNNSESPI